MVDERIQAYLATDDAEVVERWAALERWLHARFGRDASIESVLFLIGIQSRGRGYEPELDKDLKQSLIMEGTYCVFEGLGFYARAGMDADGFWIWERTVRLPDLSVEAQEKLLQIAILRYFDDLLNQD